MGETIYIPQIGAEATPSPTLFSETGAVDTWYFGKLTQQLYTFNTEVLELAFTAESAVAINYNQMPIPQVSGASFLKGVRPPFAGTGQNTYCTLSHPLVATDFDLGASDSFTLVYQTKHETFLDHNNNCILLLDMCTNTFGKAGIVIDYHPTLVDVWIVDDAAATHRTRFTYPVSFSPWKSGQFITWKWVFDRALTRGVVHTKIEGASSVDQSANCVKAAGPNWSATGAVTFSGGSPGFSWFGYGSQTSPAGGVVCNMYQAAFAKNITYDPGVLP